MRRLALLAVASITSLALATPALTVTAHAADGNSDRVVQTDLAKKKKQKKITKLKRDKKGVQPGIGNQKITASVKGSGKVKFTLKGVGIKVNDKVKVKKGKAVYVPPGLGTGKYKVTAKFGKSKKKTKFTVYNSALSVNATTFTFSASADPATYAPLNGTVLFKDKPASGGYVDFYLNGANKLGNDSPNLLGFVGIEPGGSFDASTNFGEQITKGGLQLAGANTAAFPARAEPYYFQAYYTDDAGYEDYISSNLITVYVTP